MKVRLELNGPIKLPDGKRIVEVEVSPGTPVSEILGRSLQCPPEQVRFLQVSRNGSALAPGEPLEGACTLKVFLRLGGG